MNTTDDPHHRRQEEEETTAVAGETDEPRPHLHDVTVPAAVCAYTHVSDPLNVINNVIATTRPADDDIVMDPTTSTSTAAAAIMTSMTKTTTTTSAVDHHHHAAASTTPLEALAPVADPLSVSVSVSVGAAYDDAVERREQQQQQQQQQLTSTGVAAAPFSNGSRDDTDTGTGNDAATATATPVAEHDDAVAADPERTTEPPPPLLLQSNDHDNNNHDHDNNNHDHDNNAAVTTTISNHGDDSNNNNSSSIPLPTATTTPAPGFPVVLQTDQFRKSNKSILEQHHHHHQHQQQKTIANLQQEIQQQANKTREQQQQQYMQSMIHRAAYENVSALTAFTNPMSHAAVSLAAAASNLTMNIHQFMPMASMVAAQQQQQHSIGSAAAPAVVHVSAPQAAAVPSSAPQEKEKEHDKTATATAAAAAMMYSNIMANAANNYGTCYTNNGPSSSSPSIMMMRRGMMPRPIIPLNNPPPDCRTPYTELNRQIKMVHHQQQQQASSSSRNMGHMGSSRAALQKLLPLAPQMMMTSSSSSSPTAGNGNGTVEEDGVTAASQKLDKLADVAAAATAAAGGGGGDDSKGVSVSESSNNNKGAADIPGDHRGNKVAKIDFGSSPQNHQQQHHGANSVLDVPGSYTLALQERPGKGSTIGGSGSKRKIVRADYRGNKLCSSLEEKEMHLLKDASWSKREKKLWTVDEDLQLKRLIADHGIGNWSEIARRLNFSGSSRSGKQCRERWHNHLDPDVKKGGWSADDDDLIQKLQCAYGNRWAKIAEFVPGRTDNAIKNRFHTLQRIKKKEAERKLAIDRAMARNLTLNPGDPYPGIKGAIVSYPGDTDKGEVVDKIIEILEGDNMNDEGELIKKEEAEGGDEEGEGEVGPYSALLEKVAKKEREMEFRKNRALLELKKSRLRRKAEEELKKSAKSDAVIEVESQMAAQEQNNIAYPKVEENLEETPKSSSEGFDEARIRGTWTKVEDEMIIMLHERFGNRWVNIAENIPGRTDNAVKNRYHIVRRRRGIPLKITRHRKPKPKGKSKSKHQNGDLKSPAKRLYPLPTFMSPSSSRKGSANKKIKSNDTNNVYSECGGQLRYQEYVPPTMAGFLDDDNARMYFGHTNEGIIAEGYWNKEDEQSAGILGGIISCYAKKLEDQVRINPLIGRCGFCRKFGDENKKIFCDGKDCNEEYHMECLKPPLEKVPEGVWLCPKCANPPKMPMVQVKKAASTNCSTCDKGGDDLIPCDGCPKLFHMECLPEGLSKESLFNDEYPWYCPACVTVSK